jgi:hypothetical protein
VSASRLHLHRLFDGLDGYVALGMGFGGRFEGEAYKFPDGSWAEDFFRWPDHEDALLAKVEEHVETADIYVCALLRKTRSRKQGTGALGRFAWADIDGQAPSGWERALLGPSSFVVGSGRGQHPYIALPDPVDAAELENLNRRLAKALDADSGWSETKYLRLAGTLNHKPRARGGESASVDFLKVVTGKRDWTLEELRELLPVAYQVPDNGDQLIEPVMPENVPAHLLERLAEESSDNRSKQSYLFVCACLDAGLDDAATTALALRHRPTKEKYGSDDPRYDRRAKEIARLIRRVRPSGAAPGTHLVDRPEAGVESAGASLRPDGVGTQDGTHPLQPPSVKAPEPSLVVVEAAAFAKVDEASAEPLLGDERGTVLAAGGSSTTFGDGGAGKTTLKLDQAFHMCTGTDWLGLRVLRRCTVLWIENEGPRGKFREKLRAKFEAWDGPDLEGRLHVLEQPWSLFTFGDERHRAELVALIRDLGVDIVFAGPVQRLGVEGGGTPAEIQAFVNLLEQVRAELDRPLAYELIHHENKSGEVSGAWEGATDTLAHVQARGNGHTAIVWRKVRWASELHGKTWKLDWLPGEGFELDETPETTDDVIADQLLALVREAPGKSWNSYDELLQGKGKRKRVVRDQLLEDGRLVNGGTAKSMRLYLPEQQPDLLSEDAA